MSESERVLTDKLTMMYELGFDDGQLESEERWLAAVNQLREFREKDSMYCQVLDRLMEIVQVPREG